MAYVRAFLRGVRLSTAPVDARVRQGLTVNRMMSTVAEDDKDPLAPFKDQYDIDKEMPPPRRGWAADELRRKSSGDLEKLWVVLCKERNMLLTSKHHHNKLKTEMPHKERLRMVHQSMARLQLVASERNRYADDCDARERMRVHVKRRAGALRLPPSEAARVVEAE